ncbi:MAG: HEPN domain-containing protein [Dehalococcoidia bacterium]
MVNIPADQPIFLAKAEESLAGAESELAAGRYNNCVNRCYFACFQAAIVALMQAGVTPPGARRLWARDFVQSEFSGRLIHRRKQYPPDFKNTLARLLVLRQEAGYRAVEVSQRQAMQAIRLAHRFVQSVRARTGGA